jgi:hypothetical protein
MLPVWQALKEGREPSAEEVSEWSAVSKRLMWEWKRLKLVDDVMYREWYDSRGRLEKDLLVVPRRIRSKVMEATHDGEVTGHYGERPTGVKFVSTFIGQECSQISGDTAQVVMSVSRVEHRQRDLIIRYNKIKLVSRCRE